MLKVDLGRLERERRVAVEDQVPPDADLWRGTDLRLVGPVTVEAVVQKAGPDVVVRGRVRGEVELSCRRCLERVRVPVDEELTALYRAGVSAVEAEEQDAYALPKRGRDLDLSEAVRQQVVVSVPRYAVCREACRGLCPGCGANLNDGPCGCEEEGGDERWAALRRLRPE